MIMNENINLYEILKDCPKGTKFYSPLFGDVTFLGVTDNVNEAFPIKTLGENRTTKTFTFDGRYDPFNKECLLFPSKDQRDWSKFKCSKPKFDPNTLKPFDKVLVRDTLYSNWICDLFSNIIEYEYYQYKCVGNSYVYCIPYNDDTKHLVGKADSTPEYYKYWED